MRSWTRLAAMAVAGMLCAPAFGWAADDAADTEAPADEAVGKCVTKCESEHDACVAAAKTRNDECERQKSTCELRCSMCTRMYGPQVVYCVNDCEACRARIASSPCTKAPADDADCTRTLDACLERCGP